MKHVKYWFGFELNHCLVYNTHWYVSLDAAGDDFHILGIYLSTMPRLTPSREMEQVETTAVQLWKLIPWTCLNACKRPCSLPIWKPGFLMNIAPIHLQQWLRCSSFAHPADPSGWRCKSMFVLCILMLHSDGSPSGIFKNSSQILAQMKVSLDGASGCRCI